MAHRHGSGFTSRPGLNARQPLFGGAGSAQHNDQLQINIESGALDIDDEIDQLSSSLGRLKQVSEAIGEENRLTAQVMDSLETAMEQARLSLRKTMKRLGRAFRQSKSNHMLYLMLFGLAMFFAVFFWSKLSRLWKWVS
ncbi:hypothetical protein D9Q98_005545 [Chlorella vulgaris]|uniref:t-SNARE coiled-coil homology domain-containing protein n=1 Tax=Chlorella vulgaris TaxID=3077 RepID=A0A9D4TMF1_CHLVU|nr:hypothetical protein D9Q98_005545 [Chlorella vulgaris]